MPDWAIALLRFFLGFLFLLAGCAKLVQGRRALAEAIHALQLVPPAMGNVVAATLPWLEVGVGVVLLLGLLALWPVALAALLLCGFTGAIAISLLRGQRDLSCGCFGATATGRIGWWLVARNLALAGAAFAAMTSPSIPTPWGRPDFTYAFLGSAALVESLAVARAVRSWRHAAAPQSRHLLATQPKGNSPQGGW